MELPEYKNWRLSVFKRDEFTCQICGIKENGNIEAHHLKSFYSICEEYGIMTTDKARECKELWATLNGQTLCKKCHRMTDNYGKKSKTLIN